MTVYKTILKEIKVADKEICDICGKETHNLSRLSYGHNDWGNDSIESVEIVEYCSPICYRVAAEQFLSSDCATYDSAYFDDINLANLKALMKYDK